MEQESLFDRPNCTLDETKPAKRRFMRSIPCPELSILTPMRAAMACLLLGLFAPVGAHQARAQQDPQSSTFFQTPLPFNPAFAGLEQRLNARSVSRLQWVGWGGAPQTQMITIDTPVFFEFGGAGLTLVQDNIGARTQTSVMFSGATHIPLTDRIRLSVGLSGGWRYQSFDFTNLEFVEDPSDEVYNGVYQEWSPNFGAGTFLTTQKSYFGVSVPNILMESLADSTGTSSYQRHFYAMAGHRQKVNVALSIQYNGLFKVTPNAPPSLDLNMLAMWMDSFGLGATWRMAESMGMMFKVKFSDGLSAIYVAELPFNRLRTQNLGSHELGVAWNIQYKDQITMHPRFF